jgi:PHD/YefM family antitoxin component YafN of YafNO toxin-antitoxin module
VVVVVARRGTEKSVLVPIVMLARWASDLEEARRLASEGDARRSDERIKKTITELRLAATETT